MFKKIYHTNIQYYFYTLLNNDIYYIKVDLIVLMFINSRGLLMWNKTDLTLIDLLFCYIL